MDSGPLAYGTICEPAVFVQPVMPEPVKVAPA
jgi:hypothetical protein